MIGVLLSAATLSYGIEVMTPAVIEMPRGSAPLSISIEAEFLCECREDLEPLLLLAPLGASGYSAPSSNTLDSTGRSLPNFLPKKDLCPDD